MEGEAAVVRSADGTPIGVRSAGSGPPLLLVHGGLTGKARWAPLLPFLLPRFRVTAFDRRGRGASGDAPAYAFEREFEDVLAVASRAAEEAGRPVDVFGHSIGGTVALGAAGIGAPVRRLALYEPPGPPTVSSGWVDRVRVHMAADRPGPAVVDFLVSVIGLTPEQLAALRDAGAGGEDVLGIASRTMLREAEALAAVDLAALAAPVRQPVLLLHGTASPAWASSVVGTLAAALPHARTALLPGAGHEGVDTAAGEVADRLVRFLG